MKIGLFFGSFNPLHVGHKIIASYMAEFSNLDKVMFVVSPQNPLKNKQSLLKFLMSIKSAPYLIHIIFLFNLFFL